MSAPSRHQLRVLELLARDPDFTLKERFGMVTASHGVRVITTTVDALRERGLIEGTPEEAISGIYTVYRITEAGRRALEPKPPARRVTPGDRIRALEGALRQLAALVEHGEAPSIGDTPQDGLVGRWYVRLATEVVNLRDELAPERP